jgi:hypothetical protein
MHSDTNVTPAAKLPVVRTVVEGLASLRPAWRKVALLLLVILFLELAFDILSAHAYGLIGRLWNDHAADILLLIIGALLRTLLYVNLLLAIARLVLFAEPPSVTGLFRWGRRQWRIFWSYFVVGIVAAVPIVVGAVMTPRLGSLLSVPEAILALQAIYALCWLWAASWLSQLIPLIASDDPAAAIDKAWRIATGNRFRLLGILGCILFGMLIVVGSAQIFDTFFPIELFKFEMPGYALTTLLLEAVYVAYAAIGAAAYRRLTGQVVDRETAEAI